MKEIDFRADLLPHKNKLYRLALRIMQQREDAEDAVQETLLRAWEHRSELATVKSIEAYLLTICRNISLDQIARKEHQNLPLSEADAERPSAEEGAQERLEREERWRRVETIFRRLPEKQRSVMQLRDIEGMSYRETAEALGLTEDVVRVTLHRARAFIRKTLEQDTSYGL